MANYHLEIQNVVNTALAELEAEHKAASLPMRQWLTTIF